MVGEVEPELREVERGRRSRTVAAEAGRLDQRRHISFKHLGTRVVRPGYRHQPYGEYRDE